MRRLAAALALFALAGCGGATAPATESNRLGSVQLVEALQEGGLVVYLRHAATDPAQLDRNISNLENCEGQRNLTEHGRAQAREIGRAFRALEIPVGNVLSSEYCRTRQTAGLAFDDVELEPNLTGFPGSDETVLFKQRKRLTQELLGRMPPEGENTVLVAHTKNLEAAASVRLEEGELGVFEPLGGARYRYLGHIPAAAWSQLVAELRPGS